MDAMLALRLLAELHRNFNRQLGVACIDIGSAFDSVDRVALWRALRGSGVPPFLLRLVRDLHTGATARVRAPQGMSDVFCTTSGVRQGCILAPALFCCAVGWLMRHCSGCFGVDVGNFRLAGVSCADDAVLFADDPAGWDCVFGVLRRRRPLWVSTQTGMERGSGVLELGLLQGQSILTIKQ